MASSTTTTTTSSLPQTHRALRQTIYAQAPSVQTVPIPEAVAGSAVVRILSAGVISYTKDVYNGVRKYPYPTPLTLGFSAVGRVAAVGPDATLLKPGDLVLVDSTVRSRDQPSDVFLSAVHEGYNEGSKKLMHGEWRDGTFAEYAKVPLENCFLLDERKLLGKVGDGGLGYEVEDLLAIPKLLVPYGGLVDIDIKPGETVIVAPATGGFGGAAVHVALAMGAGKVIAMGRNEAVLDKITQISSRIVKVKMTGNLEEEVQALKKHGPIDAFFDISPPVASKSTHFKAGILSLRHSGRMSLMGGQREDVPIPHVVVMHWNLTLKGKWMYERDDINSLLKMVHSGILTLKEGHGLPCVGKFGLEQWEEAFDAAEKLMSEGHVVLNP